MNGVSLAPVSPDLVGLAEVIAARGGALGRPLHVMAETTSTNDEAKAGARRDAPHGAVWLAETQTAGRGRQGRTWISPRGENLLFSVLLRVQCLASRVPTISLVAGLAVRDAVAKAVGDDERVLVKWPNDVVVRAEDGALRKISGVLVESALAGTNVAWVVVGVGVNVHTRRFEGEIAGTATSIALEARPGAPRPERGVLLADILASLDRDVEHVVHRGLGLVHARLTKHDALVGSAVESDDGSVSGIARGIDNDGRLVVERSDGVVTRIVSGEVRIRPRSR